MPSKKTTGRRRGSQGDAPVRAGADARGRGSPRWLEVADLLERQISSGRFKETGRLPMEAQLAADLRVTRHTLRRAVSSLVDKGILRSVPHMGTYISPLRIPFTLAPETRFAEAVRAAGLRPGVRELSRRVCAPPPEVAKMLGIASRTQVTEVIDLLLVNDVPLGCVLVWLPVDRFPRIGDMIDAAGSVRRALASTGVTSNHRRTATLIARPADDREREWMGLESGALVISVEGVNVDASDEPIHVFSYRLHADRIALIVRPP
jgi:GntR family phosphonate transport system transcriptional regulator